MLKMKNNSEIYDIIQSIGTTDYIDDNGDITTDVEISSIMVRSSSDLTSLSDYKPGTIAYTAGFSSMWQKSADGTWSEI